MTHRKTHAPAAALVALLLAGCAGTHVGDEWQCPLPKGGACGSVAEADPAVPDPAAAENTVLREPLWRPRPERAPGAPPVAVRSCEAGCGGFDPFAWLARLFGGDGGDGGVRPAATGAGPAAEASPASTEPPPAEAATGALPTEPGPVQDEPVQDEPVVDDLRTEEVVARIWIAPFVDAGGVYREAAWVRVVLEPAGWRVE